MTERTFDRRVQYDERSRSFGISSVIEDRPLRGYTWGCPVRLNQGSEGACVGFSWAQELAARPKVHLRVDEQVAKSVYYAAQLVDPWADTPPQEGTSVLAGAKTMQDRGYLREYRWCFSLRDLQLAVGYAGPVVLGIWWWTGMMKTDMKGFVHLTGNREGGHAILCNGYSVRYKRFRLVNSWGRGWGMNGECLVSEEDMETLLHDQGEACVPSVRTFVVGLR